MRLQAGSNITLNQVKETSSENTWPTSFISCWTSETLQAALDALRFLVALTYLRVPIALQGVVVCCS